MADYYQISEEDIDVMVKNLEFSDPVNANREYAKAKLEEMQAEMRYLAKNDPEKYFETKKKLDRPDDPNS